MEYTIGETYTLPSLGKVYDRQINPNIKLRAMTTNEEMKRLGQSDRPLSVMSEIIDDCLVDKPGISAYDMCLGDYQFLLHKLRVVTYGPEYKITTTCPYCGNRMEGEIDLDKLEVLTYNEKLNKYFEFDLPRSKKHIKIRMQTPRMVDDIAQKANEMRRKTKDSGDPAFLFTLQSIIDEVDGVKLDVIKIEDFVRNLEMMDANKIIRYSDKLNNAVGIKNEVERTCDLCGLVYTNPFRQTTEFFGPTYDD